jgi:signal transduction histidine kinase
LIEGTEVKDVGIDREALLGKTLSEAFPAEIAHGIEPLLQKTLAGEVTVTETTFAERTYQVYYVPIYDDDGAVIAGLSISQNITKRVQAEKELEASLVNEKRARREAQEAVRMKDMFLATMSHELRTPLNAMIGFLHLTLFSGQLDDDNTHMVERTIANSQRLLNLINNILDISRIASGGLQLVPAKMSPKELALTMHENFSLQAKERGIELTYSVAEDVPEYITHDEERLGQIILNLVGNAIKFTEKGSIDLSLSRHDENLVITVADTGIGMPPSRQHVIFDDFVQLDNTTTRKHQGAGLGLSIVRRLTLLMKGSIKLTSEVGKGSTFTVEVPMELVVAE